MAIEVKIKGFEEFTRNVGEARDKFIPLARRGLTKTVTLIQKEAKKEADPSKDLGGLIRGIRRTVKGLTGEVVAGAKHSIFIEEGTRPHWAPIAPLQAWAGRKLGDSGLGYAVQAKIAMKGTKAQPFMQPAVDKNMSKVEKIFEEVADDLVRILAK